MAFNRQALRRRRLGKGEQHIDGARPKLSHIVPLGDLGPEHPVSEVLEDEETTIEVEGIDRRRRQRALAERGGDRDERRHVLGQMHQGRVRLTVADRGSVGLARRIHQDGAPVRKHEARIRSRRGIALQMLGSRLGVGGLVEERGELPDALEPFRPTSVAGQNDAAHVRRRRLVHGDVEAILREPASRALRPLDQENAFGERIVEAELAKLGRLQPVEIAMGDDEPGRLVTLHQREGRARHLAFAAEPVNQSPRQCRLAGAERARERDHVTGLQGESKTARDDVEPDQVDIVKSPTGAHPARLDL